MRVRTQVRLLLVALLSAVLAATLLAPAQAAPRAGAYPDRIELPDGFQPEGITIGREPVAYLGSRGDGDILAADLRTGQTRVVSQGPGTGSIGLKVDRRGRLFVAGGAAGTGRVVSSRTGEVLANYQFAADVSTTNPSFVNDVVLTRNGAVFTDSRRAQLYVVTLPRRGTAPDARVRTLPLGGDWDQVAGVNNANGITLTPDGRALLVVQSSTGFLFRVDPATGVARRVDLGGTLLTNGDGLLLRGRTLFAVQNRLNQVAVLRLNRSGTEGRLAATLTSPDFDVPTTVAQYRGNLYLPNARFGVANPTTADYWITKLPLGY